MSIEQKTMQIKTAISDFKRRHIYLYQQPVVEQPLPQAVAENDIDKMSDEEYHAYKNREPTRRK